ncbi:MAG: S1C family serine protease [Gemmatimonadota bacterium]
MASRAYWAIAASLFTATSVLAQGVQSPQADATWSAALARVSAATVTLEVQGACCGASGTGLLLTPTGLIATSAHVIAGAQRVRVRLSTGEVFDAVGMLSYAPRLDLALILIPGIALPSARLADSDSLVVGQRLLAVGVPFGEGTTATETLLRAVRSEDGVRWLQLSVPVFPSAGGGPVVNAQGDVVGLVVVGAPGGVEPLDMAIPINDVRGAVGRLTGRTPTPFAEMIYAGTASMPGGAPSSYDPPIVAAAGAARPSSDFDLDFRPLNGVVLYFEEQYAGLHSVRDSTGYVVSSTPDGRPAVERHNYREWRDQGANAPLAAQQIRTTYVVGASNRAASAFTLKPRARSIPTVSWELHIEGERYWYSSAEGVHEGQATPGVAPREMLSAVLAALPDDLPPEVRVSVLDAEADSSLDVIVRFGGHESRAIPVPLDGRACTADVPTRSVAVDVVRATRRMGTETVTLVVLARRPHVILGGATVGMTARLTCAVLPAAGPVAALSMP